MLNLAEGERIYRLRRSLRVEMAMMRSAYPQGRAGVELYCVSADRKGVLFVGPDAPEGMLKLVEGEWELLCRAIFRTAQLSKDTEAWLVPGIPEARLDYEAMDALIAYQAKLVAVVEKLQLNARDVSFNDDEAAEEYTEARRCWTRKIKTSAKA